MDYIAISQNLRTFLQSEFLNSYPVNRKIIDSCRNRIDHFLSVSEKTKIYEDLFSAPERTLVLNANALINDALRANRLATTQLETVKKAPAKEQKAAQVTAKKAMEVATAKISEAVKAVDTATKTLETIAGKISYSSLKREEKVSTSREASGDVSKAALPKARNRETGDVIETEKQQKTAKKSKEASDKTLQKKAKVRKEVATEIERAAKHTSKLQTKKKK